MAYNGVNTLPVVAMAKAEVDSTPNVDEYIERVKAAMQDYFEKREEKII